MKNNNLTNIKKESIKSIYKFIAQSDSVNRATISEATNLSLMTVGKVVDLLLDFNLISQVKEVKAIAGRKAGIVNINNEFYCAVFDLASRNFSVTVISTKLEQLDCFNYHYDNDTSYIENLNFFIDASFKYISEKYKNDRFMGLGVLMPDSYDPANRICYSRRIPEITKIDIYSELQKRFSDMNIHIDSAVNAAAFSNVTEIEDYTNKSIVYLFMGDYIAGALLVNGKIIDGAHHCAGNVGKICDSDGKTLDSILLPGLARKDACEKISLTVYNLLMAYDPDVMIIENVMSQDKKEFCVGIEDVLRRKYFSNITIMPEIRSSESNMRHSIRGMSLMIRNQWLELLISGKI